MPILDMVHNITSHQRSVKHSKSSPELWYSSSLAALLGTPQSTTASTSRFSDTDSAISLKVLDCSSFEKGEPVASSRSEFILNTQLNKYLPLSGSHYSLQVNDSLITNEVSTTSTASSDLVNCNNSNAIQTCLSKYIYPKRSTAAPVVVGQSWNYQVFPITLCRSKSRRLTFADHMPKYYEIQPNQQVDRQYKRYRCNSPKRLSEPVRYENKRLLGDNLEVDPELYTEILGTNPDESVLAGLQAVVNLVEVNPDIDHAYALIEASSGSNPNFDQQPMIIEPQAKRESVVNSKLEYGTRNSKYSGRVPLDRTDDDDLGCVRESVDRTHIPESYLDTKRNSIYGRGVEMECRESSCDCAGGCSCSCANNPNKRCPPRCTRACNRESIYYNLTNTATPPPFKAESKGSRHSNRSSTKSKEKPQPRSPAVQSPTCSNRNILEKDFLEKISDEWKNRRDSQKVQFLTSENFPSVEITPTPQITQNTAVQCYTVQENQSAGCCKTKKKKEKPQGDVNITDKEPIEVNYAQTVITRFNNFTVYEVLKSSRKKPSKLHKMTESIFVVRK